MESAGGVQCAVHVAAVAAVEQFKVAIDRVRDTGGLGGACIGRIGKHDLARRVARPDRNADRLDQRANGGGLCGLLLVAKAQVGEFRFDGKRKAGGKIFQAGDIKGDAGRIQFASIEN